MTARTQKRLPLHRLPVFHVLIAQLVFVILLTVLLLVWLGWVAGYSGFLGGVIAWLPNLYFARKAFRYGGARAARDILKSFYAGEAGKFILTAALFALLFASISFVNHYNFRTDALDLGAYVNATYDYSHGKWNDSSSFLEHPANFLSDHFIIYRSCNEINTCVHLVQKIFCP